MNQIVQVASRKLPAITPYPQLDKFREKAADLVETYDKLNEVISSASRGEASYGAKLTQNAINYVEGMLCVRDGFKKRVEDINGQLMALEPERDFEPDTATISRTAAGKKLAVLVDSFPTANVPNPTAFAGMLLEEVLAAEPTPLAVEGACRKIRRTKTFLPAIAEVLAVVEEEKTFWDKVRDALDCIESLFDELQDLHGKLTEKAQEEARKREEAKQAQQEAEERIRSKFPVNSLVGHAEKGAGTVENHSGTQALVRFKKAPLGWVNGTELFRVAEPPRSGLRVGQRVLVFPYGVGTVSTEWGDCVMVVNVKFPHGVKEVPWLRELRDDPPVNLHVIVDEAAE